MAEKPTAAVPAEASDSLLDIPEEGGGGGAEPPTDENAWHISESVKGEGDRPEWLLPKHKTVFDQAKNYRELERRLGAFTGAPEDGYKLTLEKDIAEAGIEIDTESAAYKGFSEVCQEIHMSNEGFNKLLNAYSRLSVAASNDARRRELENLGSDGREIIKYVTSWATSNLDADEIRGLKQATATADGVRFAKAMIDRVRAETTQPLSPQETSASPPLTKAQVEEMHRDPRYRRGDAEFVKKVEEAHRLLTGEA